MPKVINIIQVRDSLKEFDRARAELASGKFSGFYAVLMRPSGEDTLISGGAGREARRAARASLRISAARVLDEDEPPLFQSGT